MSANDHSANRSQFNDPANWDAASTSETAIDELEPIDTTTSEYRTAAVRLLCALAAIDLYMISGQNVPIRWVQVSIALGLPSTAGQSVTAIAEQIGVTKQALSRGSVKVLRMTGLPPALGLKSEAARQTYQQTNGVRHE